MSSHLNVVGNDGDVLEVERRINLVHYIERRWFIVMKSKYLWKINKNL